MLPILKQIEKFKAVPFFFIFNIVLISIYFSFLYLGGGSMNEDIFSSELTYNKFAGENKLFFTGTVLSNCINKLEKGKK